VVGVMPIQSMAVRFLRGVSEGARGWWFGRLLWIAGVDRETTFGSWMKSRGGCLLSPIGVSRLIGSLAIFITFRTFSKAGSFSPVLPGSVRGRFRAASAVTCAPVVDGFDLCTGMRMVRAWSAIERVIAWRSPGRVVLNL